jgi:hypothetical protein
MPTTPPSPPSSVDIAQSCKHTPQATTAECSSNHSRPHACANCQRNTLHSVTSASQHASVSRLWYRVHGGPGGATPCVRPAAATMWPGREPPHDWGHVNTSSSAHCSAMCQLCTPHACTGAAGHDVKGETPAHRHPARRRCQLVATNCTCDCHPQTRTGNRAHTHTHHATHTCALSRSVNEGCLQPAEHYRATGVCA